MRGSRQNFKITQHEIQFSLFASLSIASHRKQATTRFISDSLQESYTGSLQPVSDPELIKNNSVDLWRMRQCVIADSDVVSDDHHASSVACVTVDSRCKFQVKNFGASQWPFPRPR